MKMREPVRYLLAIAPLVTTSFAWPVRAAAQTVVPVAQFRSIVLRGGGTLTLRRGPTQRVTMVQGSLRQTRVAIADDWLVIDRCARHCPREYHLEIEVVTPEIASLAVENGGMIQSRGAFPPQPAIEVSVDQGGAIDIRSMAAAGVEASVNQGGAIFTNPRDSLLASVTAGGNITYWGDAVVRSSTRHGGAVVKGTAADADKPLAELGPGISPMPPVPPIPPLPSIPSS